MSSRVATAEETLACEQATITAGTSSAELMRRAGQTAAHVIETTLENEIRSGVSIYTGSGNNGGDGWVVAESLAHRGIPVTVVEIGEPKSEEASEAKQSALVRGVRQDTKPAMSVVVIDALLGTGSSGAPRGEIARAISEIESLRKAGAHVVSLDLPSGLSATDGSHDGSVTATSTITFGVMKRGALISRQVCGEITLVDIGLVENALTKLPTLVDAEWVRSRVPPIPNDAHKGIRKLLTIVGGGKQMAGAAILAGKGAMRAGIGVVRIIADPESRNAIHAGIPEALGASWDDDFNELNKIVSKSDGLAIGPGLGKSPEIREMIERMLLTWNLPVVLDADALNAFAGDVDSLAKLLGKRRAVLTPHPKEMSRLISVSTEEVSAKRFEIGAELAAKTGAAVVLKGVPTVVFSPDGERYVCAAGTAALATGGSGDILSGITATLLTQTVNTGATSAEAAACASFIHGRAAELCKFVRGVTLDDVLHAMPLAWNEAIPARGPGVITRLESR
jgi:NAD(P)H-hydrate epimerase